MESHDSSPHRSSRPAIGFPVGTGLLILVVFFLSGIFSCCYHWDRLRSLRRSPQQPTSDDDNLDQGDSRHTSPSKKQEQGNSLSRPVIMPGDQIPTYMAWPCPRQSSRLPPPLPSSPTKIVVIDIPISPPPPPIPLSAPSVAVPPSARRHYFGVFI